MENKRYLRYVVPILVTALSTSAPLVMAAPEVCQAGVGVQTTGRGLPDRDGDGISDGIDNCLELHNFSQLDSDGDGFGNACDSDLNNDLIVNAVDLGIFRLAVFSLPGDPNYNASADFNGDGFINVVDLGIMRTLFFAPPGPQGECADGVSCLGPVEFGFDSNGENDPNPVVDFVFSTNDPEIIYHARRLISGQTQCNPNIESIIEEVAQPYNPPWTFSMTENYRFHGTSTDPVELCDGSPFAIEGSFTDWCTTGGPGDGRAQRTETCEVWCPWTSKLFEEN